MEFGFGAFVVVLFLGARFVGSVMKAVRKAQREQLRSAERVDDRGRARRPQTMEELLAEMQHQFDPSPQVETATLASPTYQPANGDPVDFTSLESESEVVSLEEKFVEEGRVDRGYDEGVEEVIRKRRTMAEYRDHALTDADHRAFDARIRATAASKRHAAAFELENVRDAIKWREILGPPLGWPDRDLR